MAEPIIPLETRAKAIGTGAGRRKRAAERLGAGVGAVHDRAGAYRVEWPRCGPGTGTPARPTSQRHGEAGTPEPSAIVFCQIFVGRFGVSFSPFERLFLGRFGFGQSCGLSVIA
ncbi:hypothetical protein [Bifidobacterium breve]|uniref:hypothetical protein n=1 Tax=Bifidobacterium breve TaxID=1685 RepID=UPI001F215DA4|nr:hypothetical protein [Bifidobacterium breve]